MVLLNTNYLGANQHTAYGDTEENKTISAELPADYQAQIETAKEAENEAENEETLDLD